MKIGIIGLGYWGKNILRNLKNLSFPLENIYILEKEVNDNFINSEDEFFKLDIDCYFITCPAKHHFYFIKKCLRKNKYICVTKPIFENINQALEIKKNYNSNLIFCDHTYLYHDGIKYLKKSFKNKSNGKPIYYDSERLSFGKFYDDNNVISDLCTHDIYILDYLLEGKMPINISVNSKFGLGNKNYFSNVFLQYNNDYFANIKVSWLSPLKVRKIILAFEENFILFDDNKNEEKIKIYEKSIKKKINNWSYVQGNIDVPFINYSESLYGMVKLFLDKVSKNKKVNQFQSILNVTKVVDQINKKVYENSIL